MEENNELYFDHKKDSLHDKFPGKQFEDLVELGILSDFKRIDQDNPNIEICKIHNVTIDEAIRMGIISEQK